MKTNDRNIKKQRKSNYIGYAKKILIFCEGEKTEPEYFDGFKKEIDKNAMYRNKILIETHGLGRNTKSLVSYAKNYIKDRKIVNASVWCVFDKDSFKPDDFDNAVKMCKANGFGCAWSNQCIEYWFILHFNYYDSDNDRRSYRKHLDNEYLKNVKRKYAKNDIENYNILKTYGRPKLAIKRAKKIEKLNKGKTPADSHPSTLVYMLVEELSEYLPNNEKNLFI